ncbi:hypothetical protein KIPB_017206, partial [Kipferlia bialata]
VSLVYTPYTAIIGDQIPADLLRVLRIHLASESDLSDTDMIEGVVKGYPASLENELKVCQTLSKSI